MKEGKAVTCPGRDRSILGLGWGCKEPLSKGWRKKFCVKFVLEQRRRFKFSWIYIGLTASISAGLQPDFAVFLIITFQRNVKTSIYLLQHVQRNTNRCYSLNILFATHH